jgi:phage terminase Nu1 subunit (DNA packaging protein)
MSRAHLLGSTDLAKALKVTRQAVHKWVKDGLPHRVEKGTARFDLAEVVDWRIEQARHQAREGSDLGTEQARKMSADADIAEMKRDQLRGDLVPAVDVERRMERLCAYVRVRVLGVRGKWSPKVLGLGTMADATATMDALASDILEALRDQADELDDADEDTE